MSDASDSGRARDGAAPRVVAHLDMDAFYASVELLRHPQLRGRPVVIGGSARARPVAPGDAVDGPADAAPPLVTLREYAGRGVVTTATYEARAYGVRAGIGLMKAARMAPDAVLLPVDMETYRRYSRRFKAAVREIAPRIEDRGVDEIYIDLGELLAGEPDPWAAAPALAARLRDAVRDATGLSCSIGVTPNKLLAKIASDLDKPGGITVLTHADLTTRIWPLPASRINGIGPKASARLAGYGIATIGELAAADPGWLIEHFGRSYGAWLHEAAHGRDERPVVTESEPRSISRETTFERDLDPVRDRAELGRRFTDLCTRLAADLERKGYLARSIGLKVRFDDFSTVTRDHTAARATGDSGEIRRHAGECLRRVPLARRIRLLGVRAGNLLPRQHAGTVAEPEPPRLGTTLPLFDDETGGTP
jgi:DNA polymerase-4